MIGIKTMEKYAGIVARIFLSSLYFVSIIFILLFIFGAQEGYDIYQGSLMSKGLPGIFAPISILVQFIFGIFLIVGYKIKITSYIFAIYSIVWAITYYRMMGNIPSDVSPAIYQDLILKILQYLSLFGGFLYMATNHKMLFSLDNLLEKRLQNK